MEIRSYPKVYAVGHAAILAMLPGEVVVEEKLDGSQFSMMRKDGVTYGRSRNNAMVDGAVEGMFAEAWETAKALDLHDGWVYRCEWFNKPKHNTLAYARRPEKGLIVYDIDEGLESYLPEPRRFAEAQRLGLEVVPTFHIGAVTSAEQLMAFLDRESILGGTKVEGIVLKAYGRFGKDGKTMMGKIVSEGFKEKHQGAWRKANPRSKDIVQALILGLRTEARWEKAIQHLREDGTLQNAPQDIGPLMRAVSEDVLEEEAEAIKEALWKWAWKNISRGITRGLPEWYKARLVKQAFEAS